MNYLKVVVISTIMLLGTQVSIAQNKENTNKQVDKEKVVVNVKGKVRSSSDKKATVTTQNSIVNSEEQEMNAIRERLKTAKSFNDKVE